MRISVPVNEVAKISAVANNSLTFNICNSLLDTGRPGLCFPVVPGAMAGRYNDVTAAALPMSCLQ